MSLIQKIVDLVTALQTIPAAVTAAKTALTDFETFLGSI
jgi:hypothetical protein